MKRFLPHHLICHALQLAWINYLEALGRNYTRTYHFTGVPAWPTEDKQDS